MARPTSALIVDDEAHVRVFLRLLLNELGIATTWQAAEGETALALAAEHRPELVLLDVNMPGLSGLETLARIKAAHPDLPVVMVSSENAMTTVREAARLGASGYVLKQTAKDEAREALREIIESLDGDDNEDE
jgi:two-component system chemotaxis response regulator CheY